MSSNIFTPIKERIRGFDRREVDKASNSIKQYQGQCFIERPDITLAEALESIAEPNISMSIVEKNGVPFPYKTEVFREAMENTYSNVNPHTPLLSLLPAEYLRK